MNGLELDELIREAQACTLCAPFLPLGPRPVFQVHRDARILIAGQAPGRKVHESGIPFADASGHRLRDWLGLTSEEFYEPALVAILPMGFCYPGTGSGGDLPPRPECAPKWRTPILTMLSNVKLTLVIGQYAQAYHLGTATGSLTDLVKDWRTFWPNVVPLPHPSPRNNIWLKANPWFEAEVLPEVKILVRLILTS